MEGVPCRCGEMPVMQVYCGDNGSSENGCSYILECPKCGGKGAEILRSEILAISQWESIYHAK
jgi:Zn finger protein HypA/HybF involved in hydrogenase expression